VDGRRGPSKVRACSRGTGIPTSRKRKWASSNWDTRDGQWGENISRCRAVEVFVEFLDKAGRRQTVRAKGAEAQKTSPGVVTEITVEPSVKLREACWVPGVAASYIDMTTVVADFVIYGHALSRLVSYQRTLFVSLTTRHEMERKWIRYLGR
jgi:hypothetical protein